MTLIKRTPKKRIKLAKAAEMLGCSTDTLLRQKTFKVYKLNPDSKTSPWMCFEAEVLAHLEKTEQQVG